MAVLAHDTLTTFQQGDEMTFDYEEFNSKFAKQTHAVPDQVPNSTDDTSELSRIDKSSKTRIRWWVLPGGLVSIAVGLGIAIAGLPIVPSIGFFLAGAIPITNLASKLLRYRKAHAYVWLLVGTVTYAATVFLFACIEFYPNDLTCIGPLFVILFAIPAGIAVSVLLSIVQVARG